jgi:drug/metabolite transporter (DMT)-like permease
MDLLPFTLVIVSAVSHAVWNYIAKDEEKKEVFMVLINLSSLILFLPVYFILLKVFTLPMEVLGYLLISGLAETLYFVALGKAYQTGDLSVVYPLARSSPMFLTIIAVLFLKEMITGWGLAGIAIILLGVYILHMKRLSFKDLSLPLTSLREPSSIFAITAAIGTTIYSVMDKLGVTIVNPLLYSFWLGFFDTGMLMILSLKISGLEAFKGIPRKSIVRSSVAGALMRGGYILVLIAMSMAQVSYIISLRQVSVVIGALLGVILLKESYGRIRVLSSVIIFIGVYILGVLA